MNIVGHRFHSRFAMGHFVDIHPRLAAVATDDEGSLSVEPKLAEYGVFQGCISTIAD